MGDVIIGLRYAAHAPRRATREQGVEESVRSTESELASLLEEIRELRALFEDPRRRPSPRAQEGA